MSKPTSKVKNRWNAKTYKRYTIFLRYDTDAEIIEALDKAKEDEGLTAYIKRAITTLPEK